MATSNSGDESSSSWQQQVNDIVYQLGTASTKEQQRLVKGELLPLVQERDSMDQNSVSDVVSGLKQTIELYGDRSSRLAVLKVLEETGKKNPGGLVKAIVDVLGPVVESAQPKRVAHPESIPATVAKRYVLLSWICVAIGSGKEDLASSNDKKWSLLVDWAARLLWGIAPSDRGPAKVDNKSVSISNGAHRGIWRMLRNNPGLISPMLNALLSINSSYAAVMMGNVVSTVIVSTKDTSVVEKVKDRLVEYIDKVLISSKVSISYSCIYDLRQFLQEFVGVSQVEPLFGASITKMLLRSPETALPTCLWLLQCFESDKSGLSSIYLNIFAEPLASNQLKSSKEEVRKAGSDLVTFLANMPQTEADARKAAEIATKPLTQGRYTQAEHRVNVYSLLSNTHAGPGNGWTSSVTILPALLQMAGKETQEAPVAALFKAIGSHIAVILENDGQEETTACADALQKFAGAALKGMSLPDRSLALRQGWVADAVGEALWSNTQKLASNDKLKPILKQLESVVTKASSNDGGWSANASPLEPLVGLSLSLRAAVPGADQLAKQAISSEKSFVLWDKAYHRCTAERDQMWLLRAARELFAQNCNDPRLADMLLWSLLNSSKESIQFLKEMSQIDALRLWNLMETQIMTELNQSEPTEQASWMWTNVLKTIASPTSFVDKPQETAALLERIAIAAHHPVAISAQSLRSSSLWIGLIQRLGVDPVVLCVDRMPVLTRAVYDSMDLYETAASGLAADLVLISGDAATNRLLERAQEDIGKHSLESVTKEDIAIWSTPKDQLYHDPLTSRQATSTGKQKGGSGDDVWAEKLQRELAQKRGEKKRLTKEEEGLVTAQKTKEHEIRIRVEAGRLGLVRGLLLVKSVVAGSQLVASGFMKTLVDIVIGRVVIGFGAIGVELAGSELYSAVMALATVAEGLDADICEAVAMGIMRACGLEQIVPENWIQEPLEELISRVLFRLRVQSASEPLPPSGFTFILPLLQTTAARNVKVATIKQQHDEYAQVSRAEEQLTMMVDTLGAHAKVATNTLMPRAQMLALLVKLMSEHTNLLAVCRDSLLKVAEEIEGTDTSSERDALVAGLECGDSAVRGSCLAALDFIDMTEIDYSALLWVNVGGRGTGDAALEENSELAKELWEDNGMELTRHLVKEVIPYLRSSASQIRRCAARAVAMIASDAGEDDEMVDVVLEALLNSYHEWYISLDPEYDEFGIVVPGTQHRVDIAEARVAVADGVLNLTPLFASPDQVKKLVKVLVEERALGERSSEVRQHMLAAGASAVAAHGAKWSGELMPILERFLAEPDQGTEQYDNIREGVVVLLGRLAQHLPKEDSARVAEAVDQLVATLTTPAEAVQSAVSECLPALAKRLDEDKYKSVVSSLMAQTLTAERYPERRGGAYGLAGMVKGRGLAALKQLQIVDQLRDAAVDSKMPSKRQGSLFAFETLSSTLGRLFEPYIIQFVPQLLVLFADNDPDVRAAALDTARVIMSKISGHGVKLILPAALKGLEDHQWRTKKGSVEMLGAMAYCAPKQLSTALPAVVPRIIEVLTDAHGQVAETARSALLRFGDVIHNPEIKELVPTLLSALDDPAKRTDPALKSLLHTAFVHYIDAPSLALVVPILQRGMKTRAASTKRSAAQIMGSMATLTDPKDLSPYLPDLIPELRVVLIDPVPEARATAAKALGSLVQRLTEKQFPSLVTDLVSVLKGTDASGVDRAGAAQGLSEVLAGVGVQRLEGLLPEIIANCQSARAQVREGFAMLLTYLPTTFTEDDFRQFIPKVLPAVLGGLADEAELVRAAALRAGRVLVASYSATATDDLLPELLMALQHTAWRIRHASIDLLGDLLYRVAGVSGKQAEREREAARELFSAVQEGGDEDEFEDEMPVKDKETDAEAEEDALIMSKLREILDQKLGADRTQSILASLYVARSDISAMVRQAAFGVWKSIVNNTPRTVKGCLPKIMDIVLTGLSSDDHDSRAAAARALGDLVHKLGDAVLSRVVPILERALSNDDEVNASGAGLARHGVFIGLCEILRAAGKLYADAYADAMIPLVRRGLCDSDPMVREAAASAFNSLQQAAGTRVIDSIVPPLLESLSANDQESSNALEALRELMAVRANVVFPVLIPTLTTVPVTASNARALASLAQVSPAALSKRIPKILEALFESLPIHHANNDTEAESALRETVKVVVGSAAQDEDTLVALMMMLEDNVKVKSSTVEVCLALEALCKAFGPGSAGRGRTSLGTYVLDWLRTLVEMMASTQDTVVKASWSALDALCKTIPKEDYDGYVGPVSRCVQSVTNSLPKDMQTFPGFNLPRGVGPLLPIYAQGLLAGSSDTKERSVRGMARLVKFTGPTALRPFATAITGPLIRIAGDRHPANVKAAILSALGLLLTQVPVLMRPFLPQLQRTFVRALTETEDVVRRKAALALAALIPLQPRLDPLVSELVGGLKQNGLVGVKIAMLKPLCAILRVAKNNLSEASLQTIEAVVIGTSEGVENPATVSDKRWRALRAEAFGCLCLVVGEKDAGGLISQHAVVNESSVSEVADSDLAMRLACLASVLSEAPAMLIRDGMVDQVASSVRATVQSGNHPGADAVIQGIGVAKSALLSESVTPRGNPELVQILIDIVSDPAKYDSDGRLLALSALKLLAKQRYSVTIGPKRDSVVQAAMKYVKDRNIPLKLAAERCVLYSLRMARLPKEDFDGDDEGLKDYVEMVGGESAKQVLDYQRRVLNRLASATRELDYISEDDGSEGEDDFVDDDED